jgi:hypothetical protein
MGVIGMALYPSINHVALVLPFLSLASATYTRIYACTAVHASILSGNLI